MQPNSDIRNLKNDEGAWEHQWLGLVLPRLLVSSWAILLTVKRENPNLPSKFELFQVYFFYLRVFSKYLVQDLNSDYLYGLHNFSQRNKV